MILSVVWAIIIFVCCTLPPNKIPRFNLNIQHIDKAAHFVFFFVQSILIGLLLRFQTEWRFFQIILFASFLALAYGGAIEVIQSKFASRTGELNDLIADVVGGFLGALSLRAFIK